MQISELEAIYNMSKKANEPIFLGYKKPTSRKESVGYMDITFRFRLFKCPQHIDYTCNPNQVRPVWRVAEIEKDHTVLIPLKKPNTDGTALVNIDDVFLQNPKKFKNLQILFGASGDRY